LPADAMKTLTEVNKANIATFTFGFNIRRNFDETRSIRATDNIMKLKKRNC
jgi:hypothetical protein